MILTNPTYLITQLIIGEFDYFESQNFTRVDLLHNYNLEFWYNDDLTKWYYKSTDRFIVDISIAQILKMNLEAWELFTRLETLSSDIDPFLISIYDKSKAILDRYNISNKEADIIYKDYLPLIQYLDDTGKILSEHNYNYKVKYGAIPLDLDLVNIAFTRDKDKVKELINHGANPYSLYIENFYDDGDDDESTSIISFFESEAFFYDFSLTLSRLHPPLHNENIDFNHLFRRFFGLASSNEILKILKSNSN